MILLTYTGVILLLFYVLLIGIYWIGWRLIKPFKNTTSNHLNKYRLPLAKWKDLTCRFFPKLGSILLANLN